jgi:ABC-2 type transport system ATP-binding protein
VLTCRNINFSYQANHVLKGIDISFASSAMVGILGHNGSGKSTLLKILSGLLPCKEGFLKLDGKNILERSRVNQATRALSGILLQESSSDDKLSVWDNLVFFARLMNVPKNEVNDRVQKILEDANLLSEAQVPLKKLSGGTRRRVELYRTFLHKPRLLVLDEPTGSLDFHESERFFAYARDYILENQALMLFSSHNPDDFLSCDHVVMMHKGQIIAQGTPQNLLDQFPGSRLEVELHEEIAASWLLRAGALFSSKDIPVGPSRKMSLWLSEEKLAACLNSQLLSSPGIKSFSMRPPHLGDIYERQLGRN